MARKQLLPNNLTQEERNKLVEDYLWVAYHYAGKLCIDPQFYEDCVEEAVLALVNGVIYWDENKGPWEAYARHEAQCGIKDFLYRNRLIKISTSDNTQVYSYYRAVEATEKSLNRKITNQEREEVAKSVGLRPEIYQMLNSSIDSFSAPLGDESEDTLGDVIPASNIADPIENLHIEDLIKEIDDFMNTLTSRKPEYADICRDYVRNLIIEEFKGVDDDVKKKSFLSFVASRYPQFDIMPEDDETIIAKKKKELDSIYCSVSDFWNRNKKSLYNRLVAVELI